MERFMFAFWESVVWDSLSALRQLTTASERSFSDKCFMRVPLVANSVNIVLAT